MPARSNISLRGYFENLVSGSRSIAPTDLVNLNAPSVVEHVVFNGPGTVVDKTFNLNPGDKGILIIVKAAADLTGLILTNAGVDPGVGYPLSVTVNEWSLLTNSPQGLVSQYNLRVVGTTKADCAIEIAHF